MKGLVRLALVLALGTPMVPLDASELAVISPIVVDGKPLQLPPPGGGKPVPVVERLRAGPLYASLQREATAGFTRTILALDKAAQRQVGTDSSTWLYLALEDGGFARIGFWLRENGEQRYISEPFVDLVVTEASVADGSFEEIFAHEIGHVFLRRLFPSLPPGYSRTPHSAMSVTDYPTAFDEGFATHFQGLVRRFSRSEALRAYELGLDAKPFVSYWWSNLDRATRIEGMRRNWFVRAQLAMPGPGSGPARQDQSTLFDTARLKNGNQMMSSEGAIATLFYRWLVADAVDERPIVERYSRMFAALRAMSGRAASNGRPLSPDTPFFLELADTYRAMYPSEGERLLRIILDTTYAATADPQLAAQVELLAAHGRLGGIDEFVKSLQLLRASFAELHAQVLASPVKLRSALGPDIWLLTPGTGVNRQADGVFGQGDGTALAVNLNTAEREHFLLLPGFDAERSRAALESRRTQGPYHDLADFVARVKLSGSSVAALSERQEAMRNAGPYERR